MYTLYSIYIYLFINAYAYVGLLLLGPLNTILYIHIFASVWKCMARRITHKKRGLRTANEV